ncbi:hypothetical protein Tco_0965912 [Tanacetum coccineum]
MKYEDVAEIQAVEKERKDKEYLGDRSIQKGNVQQRGSMLMEREERLKFFNINEAGKHEMNQMGLRQWMYWDCQFGDELY